MASLEKMNKIYVLGAQYKMH